MEKYQETFNTWNKIAKIYEEKFMDLDLYNDTYDIFLDSINTNSSILEIGCGPGNITKYLLEKNSTLKIRGLDISENMVALARTNIPLAEFEIMDCRNLDSINVRYDAIICGFCIPYLSESDCVKLIFDCNSLLNNSGFLYLSFVAGDYEKSGFISGSSGNRTYFYFHSLDNIQKELKANSFEIQKSISKNYKKIDGTEEIHIVLISKKRNKTSVHHK